MTTDYGKIARQRLNVCRHCLCIVGELRAYVDWLASFNAKEAAAALSHAQFGDSEFAEIIYLRSVSEPVGPRWMSFGHVFSAIDRAYKSRNLDLLKGLIVNVDQKGEVVFDLWQVAKEMGVTIQGKWIITLFALLNLMVYRAHLNSGGLNDARFYNSIQGSALALIKVFGHTNIWMLSKPLAGEELDVHVASMVAEGLSTISGQRRLFEVI